MNEVEESLSKMPFYNIKINDTDNAIIFGSKVNYCYYESCPLFFVMDMIHSSNN